MFNLIIFARILISVISSFIIANDSFPSIYTNENAVEFEIVDLTCLGFRFSSYQNSLFFQRGLVLAL